MSETNAAASAVACLPPATTADKEAFLATAGRDRDLWIFAYGSLLWDPGFAYAEAVPALLCGYHRSFCIYSYTYRGTRSRPGLVLGLDRGGSCRGRAYRVAAGAARAVLGALWDREMVSRVYLPRILRVRCGGRMVPCHTFVADRTHPQYAGRLEPEEAARIIATAAGRRGSNRAYLAHTVRQLEALGIRDGALHRLLRRVAESGETADG